jgi:hypothetical protein
VKILLAYAGGWLWCGPTWLHVDDITQMHLRICQLDLEAGGGIFFQDAGPPRRRHSDIRSPQEYSLIKNLELERRSGNLIQNMDILDSWTCPDSRWQKICGVCSKVAVLRSRRVMTRLKTINFRDVIFEIGKGLVNCQGTCQMASFLLAIKL